MIKLFSKSIISLLDTFLVVLSDLCNIRFILSLIAEKKSITNILP